MVIKMVAAITHVTHEFGAAGAVPSPVSASVAHLKVNGTAMVANFASSSSIIATRIRSLRSRRSEGQINGHRATSVPKKLAFASEETSRFSAAVDRKLPSVIKGPGRDGPPIGTLASY